jgi:hypothetical protein
MQPPELSGVVLTHGERNPLPVIEQLSTICEQVVVVHDSRSGGHHIEFDQLADVSDITIVERDFDTFPAQRNAGLDKVRADWVISVDSDECLTLDLKEEIASLTPDPETKIYSIARQEIVHGKELRARLYCDYHPRLFSSDLRYAPKPEVHEEFEVADYSQAINLKNPLVHYIEDSHLELIRKAISYGRRWQKSQNSRNYNNAQILATIPNNLLRHGYWKDGMHGLGMAATNFAFRLGTRLPK